MHYALECARFKRGLIVIEDLKRRMDELGATQTEVAIACGITQPHLSKILSRTVEPGPKTKQRLNDWLAATLSANVDEPAPDLAALVQRLARLAPTKRMQIMHLLETIEGIVRH